MPEQIPLARVCCAVPVILAILSGNASAAVRKCGAIVSSEIWVAPTELEAKKKALGEWRAKAAKLGPSFDSWRLAAEKSLKCFKKTTGYECVAFGAPCIIDQTPNTPPRLPGQKDTDL